MIKRISGGFFVCALCVCFGCLSNPILPYSSSLNNIMTIKKIAAGGKINIGPFTSAKQGITEFQCRMEGPSIIPNNMTIEQYIEKAFRDDFILADIYSADAKQSLTGKIAFVDVRSPVGEGKWMFKVVYSINNREMFTIDSEYKFPSAFHAGRACKETASAFVPAVQQLVIQTCQHPEFQKAVRKK